MTACFLAPPALAVDVEPARLELTVGLDEPAQAELTITNRGPKPVGVKLSAGSYRHFQPGLRIPTAQDWIAFEPPFFTLAPDAESTVAVAIRPPAALVNDPAGEYLAAILVDEVPAEAQPPAGPGAPPPAGPGEAPPAGSSRVSIVPRLALPVYLLIRGRERVEVEITGLSAQMSRPLSGSEARRSAELLRLDTTLKNLGSVHTRPTGNIALFDADGRVVRAAGLGKSPPLLPTAILTIPTILPLPAPGRYKAVVTVEAQEGQLLQREHRFEVTEEGEVIPQAAL